MIRLRLGGGAWEGGDLLRPSAGRPMVNGGPQPADYSSGFNLSLMPRTMRLGPTASRGAGKRGTP